MKVFRHSLFVPAALLLCSALSFQATAGFFSSDDKKPAPWSKEAFLASENCADLSYTDMSEFMLKYLPATGNSKKIKQASERVMTSYMLAALAVNQANICLAESLDLKDAKEELLKEREILTSGTSMSAKEMSKQREYAANASSAIREKTLKSQGIEPAQQKSFILGASTYLLGTYKTYVIKDDADKLIKVAEADMKKEKSKASSGFSIGGIVDSVSNGSDYMAAYESLEDLTDGLPQHVTKLVATATFFIEYAESQELELDEDATAEFNEAIEW